MVYRGIKKRFESDARYNNRAEYCAFKNLSVLVKNNLPGCDSRGIKDTAQTFVAVCKGYGAGHVG